MILKYTLPDGTQKEFKLGETPIIIGRGADVDIFLPDAQASRRHCGITCWDDQFFIRDFQSRNGTLVNEKPVGVAQLKPGDIIRIGSTLITIDIQRPMGMETANITVQGEMEKGKGYHTILLEIIDEEQRQTPAPKRDLTP